MLCKSYLLLNNNVKTDQKHTRFMDKQFNWNLQILTRSHVSRIWYCDSQSEKNKEKSSSINSHASHAD